MDGHPIRERYGRWKTAINRAPCDAIGYGVEQTVARMSWTTAAPFAGPGMSWPSGMPGFTGV